ncbi:MAG: helix-turn-helix domain-containing protein [Acutalibacteraceae bacterium]
MGFDNTLNYFIQQACCTSKELAQASGVSQTVISRYRNAKRTPSPDSDSISRLSEALESLASENGITLSKEDIENSLRLSLEKDDDEIDTDALVNNLNSLVSVLDINVANLSKAINYDPSHLSRIRTFKRKPSNPAEFARKISEYTVRKYESEEDKKVIANLTGSNGDDLQTALEQWLCNGSLNNKDCIFDFLTSLNNFNLDEYIESIHFNDIKVPTVPFNIPIKRSYYGTKDMRKGELDFFKSVILSRSNKDVFMCNDMPMVEMAEDMEFNKKWMMSIAMMLKKGLHLNIIHNIDRPFNEMMLGLEAWIPIYMTGQISPYYFKKTDTSVYRHLNYVSGTAALSGECIRDHHNDGKYYLTRNKQEVEYYRKQADNLLSKANALMNIYLKDNKEIFSAFLRHDTLKEGTRRIINSSLPIHTISKDLFFKIADRNGLSSKDALNIWNCIEDIKERTKSVLLNNKIIDEISIVSEEELMSSPLSLSISEAFFDKEVMYSYAEYTEHYRQTKEFEANCANYTVLENESKGFKNIKITIHEGEWAMISKNKAPTVHFLTYHPKMVNAIERFKIPVTE